MKEHDEYKYNGSPFVKWRTDSGVSATELALALGLSKTHLSDLERATAPLSDRLLARIAEMGKDAEEFNKEHKAWMEQRKTAILQKLKGPQP